MAAPTVRSTAQGAGGINSLLFTRPSGLAAGDYLLAFVGHTLVTGSETLTPPSGFATLAGPVAATGALAAYAFWKLAGPSEPSTYSFSSAFGNPGCVGVLCLAGAGQPEAAATGASPSSNPAAAPAVTTPGADRLVCVGWGVSSAAAAAVTPSGAVTQRVFQSDSPVRLDVATEAFAAPGSAGPFLAGFTGPAAANVGVTASVPPAAPATPASGGLPLYVAGFDAAPGGLTLCIAGPAAASGGPTLFAASLDAASGHRTLFTVSAGAASGDPTLYVAGATAPGSGSLRLFAAAGAVPRASGGAPLAVVGSPASGQFAAATLHAFSDASGNVGLAALPLFLPSETVGASPRAVNLWTGGAAFDAGAGLPLACSNEQSGATLGAPLYAAGSGLGDGAVPAERSLNLFLARGPAEGLTLFLQAPGVAVTAGVPGGGPFPPGYFTGDYFTGDYSPGGGSGLGAPSLFVAGLLAAPSAVLALSVPRVLGGPTAGARLYSNGF